MKILLLCFTLLLFASSVSAVCDPIEESFEFCKLDDSCTYQMYIDMNGGDDLETFTYLFNRLVYNVTLRDLVEDIVCYDANNTLAVELWVAYMANYPFCPHKNEYFDNYLKKCICRPEKDCSHIHPRKAVWHLDNNHYTGWVLLFIDFIVLVSVWRRFNSFDKQTNK